MSAPSDDKSVQQVASQLTALTTNPTPATTTTTTAAPTATANKASEPLTGLDPHDEKGEVLVSGHNQGIYKAARTFEELGLSQKLLDGVYEMKFTNPSKIQGEALPLILAKGENGQHLRHNLIGQAHHGSGKTATYALAMLSLVDENLQKPQALCVCPTRELAIQVASVVDKLAKHTKIKCFQAVSGSKRAQKATEQIIVGTPGTIRAKMKYKEFDPKTIKVLVLDEADQMLDKEGFAEQSMQIKKKMPRSAQVLLFSATFDERVKKFANKFAPKATTIHVKKEDLSLDGIKQIALVCENEAQKYQHLMDIYGLLQIGQSIIFVQRVATAKDLTNKMRKDGYSVSLLHGSMKADERDTVMDEFRVANTTVLISTNVLSRGIDVLSVNLVLNYDPPVTRNGKADPDTYIHRIGRSGRFGRKGVGISFVHDPASTKVVKDIARYFDSEIREISDLEQLEKEVKEWLDA